MNTPKPSFRIAGSLAALVIVSLLSARASAATVTIIDDNFSSAVIAGGNQQTNLSSTVWRSTLNGAQTNLLVITNDTGGIGSGNAMLLNGQNGQNVVATFPQVTLGNGDALTLTFVARFLAAPANANGNLRFGIYDGVDSSAYNGGSGYMMRRNAGGTGNDSTFGRDANLGFYPPFTAEKGLLGGADVFFFASQPNFSLGTAPHTNTFIISRTNNLVTLVFLLDGGVNGAYTNVDVSSAPNHLTTFSAVALGVRGSGIYLVDNVKLTGPPQFSAPPTLSYVKADQGLNLWATAGQYDRNSLRTTQDGTKNFMWAGNGAASYSFTIGKFPTEASRTNFLYRLYLIPVPIVSTFPDYLATDLIMLDLFMDTNNIANWVFRWKNGEPNSNGHLYTADSQITLTNANVLGTWTLDFDAAGSGVTMTAPGGASTNFVMGVHPNVPVDLTTAFSGASGQGVVYFGLFSNGTNVTDLSAAITQTAITGAGLTSLSNDWTTASSINTNEWGVVGATPYYNVPSPNARWVNWNRDEAGFALQTNLTDITVAASWSTNGLPAPALFPAHKGVLFLPSPASQMFFRMCGPGY